MNSTINYTVFLLSGGLIITLQRSPTFVVSPQEVSNALNPILATYSG